MRKVIIAAFLASAALLGGCADVGTVSADAVSCSKTSGCS